MKFILILILSFSLFHCSNKTDSRQESETEAIKTDSLKNSTQETSKAAEFDYDAQFKLENYLVEDIPDTTKIQIVNYDCSVLIYPTMEQMDEMKKNEGEDDFYVGADDSNFYQAQALWTIDSVGIKSITASKQFIKFSGEQRSWILDIRKKNLPAWNLIFFKTNKSPVIVSTTDLTTNKVRSYFLNR